MDDLWSTRQGDWRSCLISSWPGEYKPGYMCNLVLSWKRLHRHQNDRSTSREQQSYVLPPQVLVDYAKQGDLEGLRHHLEQNRGNKPCAPLKVNVSDGMSTPLFYACEGGYEAFAKFLLEHGAEVDLPTKNQVTPLFAASQAGATPIVRLLLRQGANPLLRATPEGALPLYVACLEGHLDVAKELVCFPPGPEGQRMYVNVDLINEEGLQRDGNTALMACCERGHKEIVEFLLDNGAEIDKRARNGETALFWAVQECHLDIVSLLLQRGSNVNIQKYDGATPLFLAVVCGDTRMVQLLLSSGATNDIRSKEGESPYDVAQQTGRAELEALFRVDPSSP